MEASQLESSARRELRGLGRANAENVAKHLVMVQRLLDDDPQGAFEHARYAASHAGRVAVVREAAAIAGYLAGHYHDALRDLRAARRLSGLDLHRAIEADCERALGHLDRALRAAEEADPRQLDDVEEAELAMVVSGVRHEMGQTELGLVVIEEAIMMFRGDRETLRRLHSVRADRLAELGREEEAEAVRSRIGQAPSTEQDDDVEVYDLVAEAEQEQVAAGEHGEHAERTEHGQTSPAPDGPTPLDTDADPGDDEDADWDEAFRARVEDELAEIIGESEDAAGSQPHTSAPHPLEVSESEETA